MTILILNWRSIKDPLHGGAEVATIEHAKRWVENHNTKVIWISPPYIDTNDRRKKNEKVDGVNFEYLGIPLKRDNVFQMIFAFPLFYFLVFFKYLTHYRKEIDVIIDQVHGLPYLTPLYSNKKIIVYVHEVAGDIWNKMYKFPINIIGKTLEKIVFLPYKWRNIAFVTVSEATKDDLIKIGVKSKKIDIVHNGVSLEPVEYETPRAKARGFLSPITIVDQLHPRTKVRGFKFGDNKNIKKPRELTIIYLNRLVKMKGIERALKVFSVILKKEPNAKLNIVGKGETDYVTHLRNLSKNLGTEKNIKFWGYVDEKTKISLLQNARVLINTSYKEGWGLVNIEANTQGTPAVVFNVAGNSESIKNGTNGYIVESEKEMAEKILYIYKKNPLIKESIEYSKHFDWNKQSEEFYKVISGTTEKA